MGLKMGSDYSVTFYNSRGGELGSYYNIPVPREGEKVTLLGEGTRRVNDVEHHPQNGSDTPYVVVVLGPKLCEARHIKARWMRAWPEQARYFDEAHKIALSQRGWLR